MNSRIFCTLLVAFTIYSTADSARILGIFPTDTRSHYMMYGKLMEALARRGHHVTVVSPFREEVVVENKTDICLNDTYVPPIMDMDELIALTQMGNLYEIYTFCLETCKNVLIKQLVHDLIKSKDFDLFVTEIFGADCFLPIGHKLEVPTVGIVSSVLLPWVNDMVGNPDNPSYIPQYFLPFPQKLNFFQRTYSTIMYVIMKANYRVFSMMESQKLVYRIFGDMTPLEELSKNFSIILANSHFSLNQVRPWVPQLIEVGGLHIPKTLGKLPYDMEEYLNSSKNGVVYFSLGSIVEVESMSEQKLKDVIEVLGSLKQNVLWRINATGIKNLPKNVKTYDWTPQLEVLCHPNVKLFINHGGMMGLQESTYCGVPMLGIPMFADQTLNMADAKLKGIAEILHYNDINKKTFSEGINRILDDESYETNMKLVSKLFKDRPLHPLDNAIYWIEYVIRYRGAPNLRSPSLDLAWYQYFLLDVLAFIFISIFLLITILRLCIKKIYYKMLAKAEKIKKDN